MLDGVKRPFRCDARERIAMCRRNCCTGQLCAAPRQSQRALIIANENQQRTQVVRVVRLEHEDGVLAGVPFRSPRSTKRTVCSSLRTAARRQAPPPRARTRKHDEWWHRRGAIRKSAAVFYAMSTVIDTLRQLHEAGCFVMPNPWDAGSATPAREHGISGTGHTSAGFAWSIGRADNHVTLAEAWRISCDPCGR